MVGTAHGHKVHQITAEGHESRQNQHQQFLNPAHLGGQHLRNQGKAADRQKHRRCSLGHCREGRQHLNNPLKIQSVGGLEHIADVKPAGLQQLGRPVQGIVDVGEHLNAAEPHHQLHKHIVDDSAQQEHGAGPKALANHAFGLLPVQKLRDAHEENEHDAHADVALIQPQRQHHQHCPGKKAPLPPVPAEYRSHCHEQCQHIAVKIVEEGSRRGGYRQIRRQKAGNQDGSRRGFQPE